MEPVHRKRIRTTAALLAGALALAALAALAPGCARRPAPGASADADTLANGLPRALAAELGAWLHAWDPAIPGFAPESLAHVSRVPFRFESPQPEAGLAWKADVRSRALIVVPSPDSTRAVDFDRYLTFDTSDGSLDVGREPDSSPEFLDFAGDTAWTIDFCGTTCFYDGAYWIDASRFALTGATRTGDDANGPWQPFLDVHDLRTHERTRWLARAVDDRAFVRYQRAWNTLLRARLREAVQGGQATADTGMGPTAMR